MTSYDRATYRAFLKARSLSERLLTIHNTRNLGGSSEYDESRAVHEFSELLLAMQDAGIFRKGQADD